MWFPARSVFLSATCLAALAAAGCGGDDPAQTAGEPCGIAVQTPAEDAEFAVGNTLNTWWQSENTSGRVNVDLYRDDQFVGRLREDRPDLGSFDMTVDLFDADPGDGFRLRVNDTADPDCYGESASFSIYDPALCDLTWTNPVWQGHTRTFYHHETETLTWQSGHASRFVDIGLYIGPDLVEQVATRTPNDGEFDWSIGAHDCMPVYYRFRISDSTANNSEFRCEQLSISFKIDFHPGDEYVCSASFLSPTVGETLRRGDNLVILFTTTHFIGDEVRLELRLDGSPIVTIADRLETSPGVTVLDWTVQTGSITEPDLEYTIWLEDYTAPNCCNLETWPFLITGEVPPTR